MNIEVIYEDQDILLLNKPAGLTVNRSVTTSEPTVQDWLAPKINEWQKQWGNWEELLPENYSTEFGTPTEIFNDRLGLAHRIDKETSGILVIAKNPGALISMLHQFKTRLVEKKYLCLTHGKFKVNTGDVDLPLGRAVENRMKFGIRAEGKPAQTLYRVEKYFPHIDAPKVVADLKTKFGDNQVPKDFRDFQRKTKIYQGFTLVACMPKTGRTHQIRVHMTALGHPLVADQIYVGKKRAALDLAWCPRLFLHANQISFQHPRTKKDFKFELELPSDLNQALAYLLPD